MANMDGDIEIVGSAVEEVLSEIVRESETGVGSEYENQENRSEKRGVEEIEWSLPKGGGGMEERLEIMEEDLT